MPQRYSQALVLSGVDVLGPLPAPDLGSIARTVVAACDEIRSEGGGTDAMRECPAVVAMMMAAFDVAWVKDFNSGALDDYGKMMDQLRETARSECSSPAIRRAAQDGVSAQEGAVNLRALMAAVGRHLESLAAAGVEDGARNGGVRMIVHQAASLCGICVDDPERRLEVIGVCRAAVAREAVERVLAKGDDRVAAP